MYLLIDNETNKVLNVYRYSAIALLDKDKPDGLKGLFQQMWEGTASEVSGNRRIEVYKVIE